MKETALLKVALIYSILGLIALYFISNMIEIKDYPIQKLNSNLGEDVKLKGTVKRIVNTSNIVIMEIEQEVTTKVVMFENNNNVNLTSGDFVEILGEIQEYQGEEEIIANRIRRVR